MNTFDVSSTEYLINFKTRLLSVNSKLLFRLPVSESAKLASRGINLVEGRLNEHYLKAVLEPDGRGCHFCRLDKISNLYIDISEGNEVHVLLNPSVNWIETELPQDLSRKISADPEALKVWTETTPLARWDWIRWINSTANDETRSGRIEAACDKLRKGEKRPCCFNRCICTDLEVSKNGKLII